jgi:hypothetical protein
MKWTIAQNAPAYEGDHDLAQSPPVALVMAACRIAAGAAADAFLRVAPSPVVRPWQSATRARPGRVRRPASLDHFVGAVPTKPIF